MENNFYLSTYISPKEYNVIAPLIMAKGVGNGKETACLVAQAATIDALRKGQTLDKPTDELVCACPLLRRLAISMNDADWWKSNEERTEHLRPLIPLLLDSLGSLALTKLRAARYSNAVIHELTPMRLEWIAANTKNDKLAASCRNGVKVIADIKPITSKASAQEARYALLGLKKSAEAYAAAAAAYASAYAYAFAYAEASASAYAYPQKLKYRTAAIALFRDLAAMKEPA